MNNSNRCSECGSIANFFTQDYEGKRYYKCSRGLTTFGAEKIHRDGQFIDIPDGEEVRKKSKIVPCNTIIDQTGKVFTGIISWQDPSKKSKINPDGWVSVKVLNGKDVR